MDLASQCKELRHHAVAFELPYMGVMRVVGEDRLAWLNGMTTNDVSRLSDGGNLATAFVNLKGKLIAVGELWRRSGDVLFMTERGRIAILREWLERLIVMEDVSTSDASDEWRVLTVQGPEAAQVAPRAGLSGRPCDRSGSGGLDLLVLPSEVELEMGRLVSAGATPGVPEALEVARIEAGLPRYGIDIDEDLFPQEARVERNLVSFQKGCYVGQEIVMRLQMRGHPNRLLVPLDMGDAEPPAPGAVRRDGAVVGRLTSAVRGPTAGRTVGLALLARDAAAPGTPVRVDEDVPAIVLDAPLVKPIL